MEQTASVLTQYSSTCEARSQMGYCECQCVETWTKKLANLKSWVGFYPEKNLFFPLSGKELTKLNRHTYYYET